MKSTKKAFREKHCPGCIHWEKSSCYGILRCDLCAHFSCRTVRHSDKECDYNLSRSEIAKEAAEKREDTPTYDDKLEYGFSLLEDDIE